MFKTMHERIQAWRKFSKHLNDVATQWTEGHPYWMLFIVLSSLSIWFCCASEQTQHTMIGSGMFVLYRGIQRAIRRRKAKEAQAHA
jgi:hypothetical protein